MLPKSEAVGHTGETDRQTMSKLKDLPDISTEGKYCVGGSKNHRRLVALECHGAGDGKGRLGCTI